MNIQGTAGVYHARAEKFRLVRTTINEESPHASRPLARALALAGLVIGTGLAQAVTITDAANDFLPTYTGPQAGDLDVISASVNYNPATDTFELISTMNGAIGTTAGALYIWGVNRGAGAATFASIGATNVLFDSVVRLTNTGSGSVGANALPGGAVTISGSTITALVSGSLLPSTGFAKADYTWNIWPRGSATGGAALIPDFAPNNSNFAVTAVPEPQTWALMLSGLALAGLRVRQRRAAA